MAKYLAGGRVRGTLHGVTYQRNLYTGWVAKEKSSLSAEQVATAPAFQRTRENNNEMKGVGIAVKHLRGSLSRFLPFVTDPIVTGRMIREVKKAQLKSAGVRGQRTIGYTELCAAMKDFQVSNVYRTDMALKGLNVSAYDSKATPTDFELAASCLDIVWPAGANCAVPFLTTVEIDDVKYVPEIDAWDFDHIGLYDHISQTILMEKLIINFQPTENINITYANGEYEGEVTPASFNTTLSVTKQVNKNSDEFGRILVWFGVQFGQLVEMPVAVGENKRMEFYPLRGATAGKVVGDVAPAPAG